MTEYLVACHDCGSEVVLADPSEKINGLRAICFCPLCGSENIEVSEEESDD